MVVNRTRQPGEIFAGEHVPRFGHFEKNSSNDSQSAISSLQNTTEKSRANRGGVKGQLMPMEAAIKQHLSPIDCRLRSIETWQPFALRETAARVAESLKITSTPTALQTRVQSHGIMKAKEKLTKNPHPILHNTVSAGWLVAVWSLILLGRLLLRFLHRRGSFRFFRWNFLCLRERPTKLFVPESECVGELSWLRLSKLLGSWRLPSMSPRRLYVPPVYLFLSSVLIGQ